MSNYVGIVRSNLRLERAPCVGDNLPRNGRTLQKSILPKACELRNMINVGYLIIKFAQNMRESRLHYSINYPKVTGHRVLTIGGLFCFT